MEEGLVRVSEEGVSEEAALPAEVQAVAHRIEDATSGKQSLVDQAPSVRLLFIVVPSAPLREGLNSLSRLDAITVDSTWRHDVATHPTGPQPGEISLLASVDQQDGGFMSTPQQQLGLGVLKWGETGDCPPCPLLDTLQPGLRGRSFPSRSSAQKLPRTEGEQIR